MTAIGHTHNLLGIPPAMAERPLLYLAESHEDWPPKDLANAVRMIAHPTLRDQAVILFTALCEAVDRRRDLECRHIEPMDVDERLSNDDEGYEAALHKLCDQVDFALRPLLDGRRRT